MPIEIKEIFDYLGVKPEDIKTIDDFKTTFDKEFLRPSAISEDSEPVKKIVGKLFGTLENEIKKVAKAHELDVDFDADELKGKKVTEKLKFVFSKYDEKNNTVIEDLKTKASLGNDDKIKDWETKYGKLENKFKDVDNLLKKTSTDFDIYKVEADTKIKSVKLDVHKKDALSKIKFKPDISEFEKKGYLSTIAEKYDFDFDENENFVIKDKKGSFIQSGKTTGTFKNPLEVLEEEAVAGKLFLINKDAGKPAPANVFSQAQQTVTTPTKKVASRM